MADAQAIETARFEQILRRLEYLRQPENKKPRYSTVVSLLENDETVFLAVSDFLEEISAYDGADKITVARLTRLRKTIQQAMERRVTKEILGSPITLEDFPNRPMAT